MQLIAAVCHVTFSISKECDNIRRYVDQSAYNIKTILCNLNKARLKKRNAKKKEKTNKQSPF